MSEFAQMPAGTPISELLDFTEEYSNALEAIKRERAAEEAMPEKELVLWTGIAGLQHHVDTESRKGKKLLKSLTPGTELILKREPENPYDRWAIIVETKEGIQLGYVTRYKNETIARMMDHGHKFQAFVESAEETGKEIPEDRQAFTEQMRLPFSIWRVE